MILVLLAGERRWVRIVMRVWEEAFGDGEPPGQRVADRDRQVAALIVQLVGLDRDLPPREILAPNRRAEASLARHMAMYLAYTAYAWPLARVAAAFGRDRSTISHACRKVEDLRDDDRFDRRLAGLERCLRAAPVEPAA